MIVGGCLTCLTILAFIFVVAYLYFSILARTSVLKRIEVDNKRYEDQKAWDSQIQVLTTRIGEISTQNFTLGEALKEWQSRYVETKNALTEAEKRYDELKEKYLKLTSHNNEEDKIE